LKDRSRSVEASSKKGKSKSKKRVIGASGHLFGLIIDEQWLVVFERCSLSSASKDEKLAQNLGLEILHFLKTGHDVVRSHPHNAPIKPDKELS
jgi:hypothetical protein